MFRVDNPYKLTLNFNDWIEYVEKYLALTLTDIKQFTSPQKLVFLHYDFDSGIVDFENELINNKSLFAVEFTPSFEYWNEGDIRVLKTNESGKFYFQVQLDDLWFTTYKGRTSLGNITDLSLTVPYLNLDLNKINGRVGYNEGYCIKYEDVKKLPILLD